MVPGTLIGSAALMSAVWSVDSCLAAVVPGASSAVGHSGARSVFIIAFRSRVTVSGSLGGVPFTVSVSAIVWMCDYYAIVWPLVPV